VHIHTEVRVALRDGGRGNRHARCGAADVEDEDFRDNPELNKRIADMTALGRTGLPDDIGPMIASLLSEDNRWINAQRIEVSGGMSI
jgi:NAD(P)-dependent dehydrogenase (short-subunit alcohol dehydrogenase family)